MPRPGYLTASTFPDLMQTGKKGEPFGKAAMKHIYRLALDMLGTVRPDDITADSLEWGKINEESARYIYEEHNLCQVKKAHFKVSPTLDYVGGTADGLIGKDGILEIKCPKYSAIHMFNRDEHFKKYQWQLYGYIWIYDRKWCDFASYDPRCKEPLQLITQRIIRDAAKIELLESRCKDAHQLALELVKQVWNR